MEGGERDGEREKSMLLLSSLLPFAFFIQSMILAVRWYYPHSMWILCTQLNPLGNAHMDTNRGLCF